MISFGIGLGVGLIVGIPIGMWCVASFAWRAVRSTWRQWMT
jgi:ABC-type nitrate/sulfonate/bicarbonate transport system permease component